MCSILLIIQEAT